MEELAALTLQSNRMAVRGQEGGAVAITVGRHQWTAEVVVRTTVSLQDAKTLVRRSPHGAHLLVANQLASDAKQYLDRRNGTHADATWSWLDRRSELHLVHGDAIGIIEFGGLRSRKTELPKGWRIASARSDGPIRGRAGIALAAALLLEPDDPPALRSVARESGMSHGAIGAAAQLLRKAGLILRTGQPDTPALFWALAQVWGATRITPVASLPTESQAWRMRANPEDLSQPGWCVGGDDAAAAWGAPVFAEADRPWIWVHKESDARAIERALTASAWDEYRAVVAVAPTTLVNIRRLRAPRRAPLAFLPTAHPLFLALELAQDPDRGRSILNDWYPDEPDIRRVW